MNFNTSCINGNMNECSTAYLLSGSQLADDVITKILMENHRNVKIVFRRRLLKQSPNKAHILNTSYRKKNSSPFSTQTNSSVE